MKESIEFLKSVRGIMHRIHRGVTTAEHYAELDANNDLANFIRAYRAEMGDALYEKAYALWKDVYAITMACAYGHGQQQTASAIGAFLTWFDEYEKNIIENQT